MYNCICLRFLDSPLNQLFLESTLLLRNYIMQDVNKSVFKNSKQSPMWSNIFSHWHPLVLHKSKTSFKILKSRKQNPDCPSRHIFVKIWNKAFFSFYLPGNLFYSQQYRQHIMPLQNCWEHSFILIQCKTNFALSQLVISRCYKIYWEKKIQWQQKSPSSKKKKKKNALKQQLFRETSMDPSALEPSPGL